MDYKDVEYDFITRTLEIIKQYDDFVMKTVCPDKQFDVTLVINCLLGLIILPYEHKKRIHGGDRFPEICTCDQTAIRDLGKEWGLQRIVIKKFKVAGEIISENKSSLRKLVAMLRHSVAHSQFGDGAKPDKPIGMSISYQTSPVPSLRSQITAVNFVNIWNYTEFEAIIPIEDLKVFAVKLAQTVLAEMH